MSAQPAVPTLDFGSTPQARNPNQHQQQHHQYRDTHTPSSSATATTEASRARRESREAPGARLYFDGQEKMLRKQERMAQLRLEQIEREKRRLQCTFNPLISPYARNLQRPRSLSPENRALGEALHRKERLAVRRREVAQQELQGCTFQPLTLRMATLSPDAAVRRPRHHVELHAHHRQRQQYRAETLPQQAKEMEDHVMYPKNTVWATEEEVHDIVDRLLTVKTPKKIPLEEHRPRPVMTARSRQLAEKRQKEIEEPSQVVERLLTRPAPDRRDDHAEQGGGVHQAKRARSTTPDSRDKHLRALFEDIAAAASSQPPSRSGSARSRSSGGSDGVSGAVVPIMVFADAVVRTQSPADAADIISALGQTNAAAIDQDAFVALALSDSVRSGPKGYMYPRRGGSSASNRHQHQQGASEERKRYPQLSQRTHEMLPHRGPQAVQPDGPPTEYLVQPYRQKPRNTASQAEKEAQEEAEYCTFTPTLTPYSGPAPMPEGWVEQQQAWQRRHYGTTANNEDDFEEEVEEEEDDDAYTGEDNRHPEAQQQTRGTPSRNASRAPTTSRSAPPSSATQQVRDVEEDPHSEESELYEDTAAVATARHPAGGRHPHRHHEEVVQEEEDQQYRYHHDGRGDDRAFDDEEEALAGTQRPSQVHGRLHHQRQQREAPPPSGGDGRRASISERAAATRGGGGGGVQSLHSYGEMMMARQMADQELQCGNRRSK